MAVARCVLPEPSPPTRTRLCALGERHAGQLHDELAIDRRTAEVEAGQIAMPREPRCVHLVAD